MKNLKYYILCVELLCHQVFSALISLSGKGFVGSYSDNSYILFCVFMGVCGCVIVLYEFIVKRIKFRISNLLLLLFPVIIFGSYIIGDIHSQQAMKMFQQFLVWSVPSSLIGCYIGATNSIQKFIKPLLFFSIVILIGLAKSWLTSLSGLWSANSDSGENYQIASYSSAICYGVFLFFCLFKEYLPPKLRSLRWLAVPCMFMCIVIIMMTGGRGGMVLVIAYSCVFVFIYDKSKGIGWKNKMAILLLAVVGIAGIVYVVNTNPYIGRTAERVFSYIGDEGIDMSKTSSRDVAYAKALTNINKSPVSGYGIFKYFDYNGNYPHNFFLELLLQGGILFLAFYFMALLIYARKLILLYKNNNYDTKLFLILLIYPCVNLLFSTSYLTFGCFWFCFYYVIFSKLNKADSENLCTSSK